MGKPIILVKLGGSLITNKAKAFTVSPQVLRSLISQIKRAKRRKNIDIVVGHGSGSFAHRPAAKYRTKEGKGGAYGAAVVQDAAARLNRIVIKECLRQQVPAISLSPSSFLTARSGTLQTMALEPLTQALKTGIMPVVYGDVVFDHKTSFTIWSTEQALGALALQWLEGGRNVTKIIHCTDVDGVLASGKVVEVITPKNFVSFRTSITRAKTKDVTGGMLHKVEEALALAKKGVDSFIINGTRRNNLYEAIRGRRVLGTKITSG